MSDLIRSHFSECSGDSRSSFWSESILPTSARIFSDVPCRQRESGFQEVDTCQFVAYHPVIYLYYFLVYFQLNRHPGTNFGFSKALYILLVFVVCSRVLMRYARQKEVLFAHAH